MKDALDTLNTTERYAELFRDNFSMISEGDPDYLLKLRKTAIRQFKAEGFPVKKQEDYKYTHLEPLFIEHLPHYFKPRKIEFDISDLFRCDVPSLDTRVMMVLNGFFRRNNHKSLSELKNGIIFGSLREATRRYPDLVKQYIGKNAETEKEAFVALNTAFAQDGVLIYIPENTDAKLPFQIIHLLLSDTSQMVQHRNLFIVEKNSRADIIICDHTLSPHLFLTNSVTEVYAGKNAEIDIIRLQNEHNNSGQITNTWISQERDSRSRHSTITLHGGKVRNNLHVKLSGEGAHTEALGLFLIDKQQHVDNFAVIDHQKPHCTSNQHFKGVLDDDATGVFCGKIHVHRDAQKTEAYQSNNNILLTDTAKMHTKPQLEIYADDVKCSHGATVGQLDENALFYLQSRGISMEESRLLLMYAFANDVISRIKEPALKNRISDLVDKRLRGELSRCNN
ncbi:MAG TPA: Fe-S cluster assembly protein SufD, partial [Bacteroidaceae bacterium]|nr:Fe-S cluster assembly protein SufD [Bacteroidaceae bacterium]